jgi:hypothetical protein
LKIPLSTGKETTAPARVLTRHNQCPTEGG